MKSLFITTLLVAATIISNDCHSQSLIKKAKSKAKKSATKQAIKGGKNAAVKAKSNAVKYHLLEAERSPAGGTTKTLLLEEGDNKGTKVLVIKACEEKCTPAVYTYKEDESKKLGIKVFFNSSGIYILEYNESSFISVMSSESFGKAVFEKFIFSNFYSKEASEAKSATKEKVEAYAIKMSKQLLEANK